MKSSALIIILFMVSLMASTHVYRPTTESSNTTIGTTTFSDTILYLKQERHLAALETQRKQNKLSLILKKLEDETIPYHGLYFENLEPFTDFRTNGVLPVRKETGDTVRQ